ncbi:DUF397 domain-containing protein [Streptomyces sp. NEAU-W12]|nr:DUF397 domain-containing protein [Streptomyces sp. NEAU-W12]
MAHGFRTLVPVRDGKDPHGPTLCFANAPWAASQASGRPAGSSVPEVAGVRSASGWRGHRALVREGPVGR